MRTQKIQNKIDRLIEKTILWAIPKSFKPNYFTYLRIATIPFLYLLLERGNYIPAFILFIISAFTDALDGALARTRNQKTDIGKLLDPIVDKMLLATVLVFIGLDYLIVQIFIAVIVIEILGIIIFEYALAYKFGRPLGSNIYGKIKMILQCFGAGFFLLGIIIKNNDITYLGEIILFAALFFALLAIVKQLYLNISLQKSTKENGL